MPRKFGTKRLKQRKRRKQTTPIPRPAKEKGA